MKYRLIVTALEDNPSYAEQYKTYLERSCYSSSAPPVERFERRSLEIELTDEEYRAVRKAVVGVMA